MDFEHLYLLGDAGLRGALHVRPRDSFDEFALLKAELRPTKPLVFEHSMGDASKDLVGTEYPVLFLVSSRVVDILQRERFTGWMTYPVQVYGKGGQRKGYHGFSVTGRCGPIDNTRSRKMWRDPPTPRGNRYEVWVGLYFDPKTWDGCDIFSPQSSGHVFAIERVKDALEKAEVSNIQFKRLTEVERLML